MTITTGDTMHPKYKEVEALQQLLDNLNCAVADANEIADTSDEYLVGKISISVGGGSTEFYLGGPQINGMCKFIETVCAENGYEVDLLRGTVKAE